jgi:indole-3-glycerol phosphate synthase/phosphoribosylanthranilate isomerase
MTILETIVAARRQAVADARQRVPQASLERAAAGRRDYRGFAAALARPGLRVIAEIKRASPSRGPIAPALDPAALARAYAAGGAAALSVLTEPDFFQGSPGDLHRARAAVDLPVLRKDFIIDPYQVYETAALGADALLLIVRVLDDAQLHALHALARQIGLDVLTEVHDARDIARANLLGAPLVGINNRDLAHFKTDAGQATRLVGQLRPGCLPVALSGIRTADDIRRTLAGGIRRVLVGETLVRAPDPAATLRGWIGGSSKGLKFESSEVSSALSRALSNTENLTQRRGDAEEPCTCHPLSNLKICGITTRETAQLCADLGVGALGAVFFQGSPRCVTPEQARAMFTGLPPAVARVGVFVDRPADEVIAVAREAGLDTVQLHGAETAVTCRRVQQAGYRVIKVLKTGGTTLVEAARALPSGVGVLVECGRGALPGGNGAVWQWQEAAPLAAERAFALAGGLTSANILEATRRSGAAAWDVSSGVERAPGVKDPSEIETLVRRLRDALASGILANRAPGFWAAAAGGMQP